MSIKWPIQAAVFDGMPKTWLLFTVTDEENGSVARCCVDSDRHLTYFGITTFDDIRNSVSRIRKAIDKGALLFYPSLQAHPEPYQSVDKISAKMPLIPSAGIEKFIAGKTYMLGFQIPDVPGEIFATDPWDAEYLGATKKDLARSAYILRARGLIELDMSQTFARPSDKLVTTGWPAALGSNPTVIAPQIFELSSLPKKEDLSADLKSQLGQGCGFALIFIDLDRFKEVNDTKGHAQGDVCLGGVVKTIGSALGKKGKLYRWGGDEFAITLPDFSTNEALATAERIRKAIEESKSGGDIAVTASIGVCGADLLPEATAETLLKAADDAMYTAKHTGKNRVAPWSSQAKSEVASVPTA
jgi:diguanylate cyclase (GGDEF)-like protein